MQKLQVASHETLTWVNRHADSNTDHANDDTIRIVQQESPDVSRTEIQIATKSWTSYQWRSKTCARFEEKLIESDPGQTTYDLSVHSDALTEFLSISKNEIP